MKSKLYSALKKVIALAIGAIVSLALIEAALTTVSYLSRTTGAKEGFANDIRKGDFLIFCIGNSFTVGAGSSSEKFSYPSQLQSILKEKYNTDAIKVVNFGRVNATSSAMLMELKSLLETYSPDFVTLRIGEPNLWNLDGLSAFKEKMAGHAMVTTASKPEFLSRLSSYRLALHLYYSILLQENSNKLVTKEALTWISRVYPHYHARTIANSLSHSSKERMQESLEKFSRISPRDPRPLFMLAEMALSENDIDKAIALYHQAAERSDQFNYYIYSTLQDVLFREKSRLSSAQASAIDLAIRRAEALFPGEEDYSRLKNYFDRYQDPDYGGPEVEELYQYAISIAPGNHKHTRSYIEKALLPQNRVIEAAKYLFAMILENPPQIGVAPVYRDVMAAAQGLNSTEKAEFERSLAEFQARFHEKFDESHVSIGNRSEVLEWVLSDIREATNLLNEKGIPFVVLNYPPMVGGHERIIDSGLRKAASEGAFPFIDTFKSFEKKFVSKQDRNNAYTSQYRTYGHLSDSGYRHLADEIAEYLSTKGYLSRFKVQSEAGHQ